MSSLHDTRQGAEHRLWLGVFVCFATIVSSVLVSRHPERGAIGVQLAVAGALVLVAVVPALVALLIQPRWEAHASSEGLTLRGGRRPVPWSAIRLITYSPALGQFSSALTLTLRAPHGQLTLGMTPAAWIVREMDQDERRDPGEMLRDKLGANVDPRTEVDPADLARVELEVFRARTSSAARVGAIVLVATALATLAAGAPVAGIVAALTGGSFLFALHRTGAATAIAVGERWIGPSDRAGSLDGATSRSAGVFSFVLSPIIPLASRLERLRWGPPATESTPYRSMARRDESAASSALPRAWRPRLIIIGEPRLRPDHGARAVDMSGAPASRDAARELVRFVGTVRRPLVVASCSAVALLATSGAGVALGTVAMTCSGGVIAGAILSVSPGHKAAFVGALGVWGCVMAMLHPLSAWSALALVHLLSAYMAGQTASVLVGQGIRALRRRGRGEGAFSDQRAD